MTAAIVLFVVALLAELIAVGLIVAESRKAGTLLCEYLARNPDNHENGTFRHTLDARTPFPVPVVLTSTARNPTGHSVSPKLSPKPHPRKRHKGHKTRTSRSAPNGSPHNSESRGTS